MPEPTSSAADEFFERALKRIRKYMIAVSVVGLLVCLIFFRWPVAVGFLAGAVISYVNHRWLERAVDALGERITSRREQGAGRRDRLPRGAAICLHRHRRLCYI